MTKITTVIFDMYETLAENNPGLWIEAFKEICRTQRLDIDPEVLYNEWKAPEMVFRKERLNLEDLEKSPPFKPYEEAWRDCFEAAFSSRAIVGDALSAAKYTIRDMGLREPYPDALEVLPLIQSRWKSGVLSNADDDYLFPLIDKLGWKFEAVLSSERVGAYKPHPLPFTQITQMLGIMPEEAMYVGDTQLDDVAGAKGVGMSAVWINRRKSAPDPQLPAPDYEIYSLTELPPILEKLS